MIYFLFTKYCLNYGGILRLLRLKGERHFFAFRNPAIASSCYLEFANSRSRKNTVVSAKVFLNDGPMSTAWQQNLISGSYSWSFCALAFAMISTKLQIQVFLFSVARYFLDVISLLLMFEWQLSIAPSCGPGKQLLAELRAPMIRAQSTMGKKTWPRICAKKFGFGHRTTVWPRHICQFDHIEALFHLTLQLVYSVHLWYWTSLLWSINTCQNKVSADQSLVIISKAQV